MESPDQLKLESTSFLFIQASKFIDIMIYELDYNKRDYDILEEPLGN